LFRIVAVETRIFLLPPTYIGLPSKRTFRAEKVFPFLACGFKLEEIETDAMNMDAPDELIPPRNTDPAPPERRMETHDLAALLLAGLSEEQIGDLRKTLTRYKKLPFAKLSRLLLARQANREGHLSNEEFEEFEAITLEESCESKDMKHLADLENEITRRLGEPDDREEMQNAQQKVRSGPDAPSEQEQRLLDLFPKGGTDEAVQGFFQSAMHFEGQWFGKIQVSNPKGIQLSASEQRALYAVQTLFTRYRYQGNRPHPTLAGKNAGRELVGKNDLKFVGTLFEHDFRSTEYFAAYGVLRVKHVVNNCAYERFSPQNAADAMEALHSMAAKKFQVSYRKRVVQQEKNKKGEPYGPPVEKWVVVNALVPLLRVTPYEITQELTEPSENPHRRIYKRLIISPEPILVDQLESYYTYKPANIHDGLVHRHGKLNDFVVPFLSYLNYVAQRHVNNQKGPKTKRKTWDWTLSHTVRELGSVLKMTAYIKKRNWRRVEETLLRCYEIALKEGYLTKVDHSQEVHVLVVNQEKLPHRPSASV
jgi:hypothetical protein